MSIRADDKEVIRGSLLSAAGAGADARAIASATHTHWQYIATHLEPVLGESGVHALYARCLHLQQIAAAEAPAADSPWEPSAFLALRQHLESRQPNEALDAAVAFFEGFTTLLSSLIGARLTARLLKPVWADGHTDQPDQEKRP